MVPAIGCTEPIAVALCVARAAELLGSLPKHIDVRLSANILKNAMGVGIPGTGMIGLPIAIALGAALTFVWCVLCGVFQPAGWVFCPILLLAELLMTPILFFLWLRLLPGSCGRAVYVLLLCLSCAAAVGFMSYCLVMPASAFLIDGTFGGLSS